MSAINKNQGKPRLSLVLKDFAHAIEALARLRENNLKKYARSNWAESIGTPDEPRFLEENLESIERHVGELWKGNELDPENGDHHATAIMCRVCFILEYYYRQMESKPTREPVFGEYGFQGNRLTGEPLDTLLSSEPIKKTIYDWSNVGSQYKFMAKDQDGKVFCYQCEPLKETTGWGFRHNAEHCYRSSQTTGVPWEDSLEARPMTLSRICELNDAL